MKRRVKKRIVCDEHLSPIKHLLRPGDIVTIDPEPYENWYGTRFVVGTHERFTLLIPTHALEPL